MSKYSRVVVSGCQRSGTTILSKMLAKDLEYKCIDENEFGVHSKARFLEKLEQEKIVIHCPALSQILDTIQTPDTIIVWVLRPFEEIRRSMRRINWDVSYEKGEKDNYAIFGSIVDLSLPIEQIKYKVWKEYQIPHLKVPYLEVDYHSDYVQKHPMHLPDEKRSHFAPKQTN